MEMKKTAGKPEAAKKSARPELKEFLGEIEKKAYDFYLERNKKGSPGNEMTDWLNAEKKVKAKYKLGS